MNEINFVELREQVSSEDIKKILLKYEVAAVNETDNYIIFPTCCHNLTGGSPKLYYYKTNHMFKCYTHCEDVFDIFGLLIKMHNLRGEEITLFDAIRICDVDTKNFFQPISSVQDDINYLYNLLHTKRELIKIDPINPNIVNRFVFDKNVLELWRKEGISLDTMNKYGIKYDPIDNYIAIPNYDQDGNLISIRGRYLNEDAAAKYKPIIYGGKVLSHPSALALFGLNITKDAIRRTRKAIVFESEKSVLMMDTYYGKDNCSVATLGKNISQQQIRLLSNLGVNEVILAYDADYRNYKEMAAKRNEYKRLAASLKPYFTVSILIDTTPRVLDYKDSPIDKGKDAFEKLLKNRIYI